jgi:hypothetical protein
MRFFYPLLGRTSLKLCGAFFTDNPSMKVSFAGQTSMFQFPRREKRTQIMNFSLQMMVARTLAAPSPHPPGLFSRPERRRIPSIPASNS